MKDISIFQGWKELKGEGGHFRFENRGATWSVYHRHGDAFPHVGIIRREKRESNISLYRRACALIDE